MHEHPWQWEQHLMGPGSHRGGRPGARDAWDFFGGPPPRADRGAVRYLVLDAIEKQPRHGYEIMAAIEERSGRTYRPSPGVIYPTLQLLEELGHARVEEHDGRKTYAITADGKRDLEEHRDEVTDFYERSGAGSWEEYAEELLQWLSRWDTEYAKFIDPKIQLLTALEEHHHPRLREEVERFLEDVNEPARFHAAATLLAHGDAEALPALVKLLLDEESVRVRTKVAEGLGARAWRIPDADRAAVRKVLPPPFTVDADGRVLKR